MKRVRLKPRAVKSPDEDFTGLLEDWDDRVFLHADHFRLYRYSGRGKRDDLQTPSFPLAMRAAIGALRAGYRVLVYAITSTGRYQALVPTRWEHYAKLYNERNDNAKRVMPVRVRRGKARVA